MTDDDRDLLRFEEEWWDRLPGHREEAIRARFGISSARYYQRLYRVAGMPDATVEFPQLVRRIVDRRVLRARKRATGTPDS